MHSGQSFGWECTISGSRNIKQGAGSNLPDSSGSLDWTGRHGLVWHGLSTVFCDSGSFYRWHTGGYFKLVAEKLAEDKPKQAGAVFKVAEPDTVAFGLVP